jgi:hypothetical protein
MKHTVIAPIIMTACWGLRVFAAEAPSIGQDLKATIVLQGQSCDQIANSRRNGDSDYLVACKNGNRYHVFVNAQGRVVVEKL